MQPDLSFKAMKRKAVSFSTQTLVTTDSLAPGQTLPLVMRPAVGGVNLAEWLHNNRLHVEQQLLTHGAILFRGFNVETVERFGEAARALSPELLDYLERAAPRTEVSPNVFTSTEYPAEHPIPLHHEMSYSHNWPMKLWFYCVQPAEAGGATPIADDRQVFRRLDPKIKEIFMRKKVMYVRNYGEGVDLTWQDAFQTTDRAQVAEYCRQARTEFEWKDENRLCTRQVRQAVATHPQLGVTVWFNHAHMFHISNVEPAVRAALLEQFREEDLPRNAFYGDGAPIETSVLDEVRGVYAEESVRFSWQQHDLMLVDNILASHGREPFAGARQVVVAMAELYTNKDS